MRSISLGLLLVGAVIGGGCSGSNSSPTPTPTPTPAADHGDISSPALHAPMYYAFARGASGATDCTSCHGASLTGSTTAPGCTRCHAMPSLHPVVTAPTAHGSAYLNHGAQKNGALNCEQCHGDSLEGKWGAPSCSKCHAMPHAVGTLTGTTPTNYPAAQHGPAYVADAAACQTCHGADLSGKADAPSCARCHSMPHTMGALSDGVATNYPVAEHAQAYADLLNGAAGAKDCTGCHGASLGGATPPLTAPSCDRCHTAPSQSFVLGHGPFSGSIQSASIPAHGANYFDYAQSVPGSLDCTTCHGANLEGTSNVVACSTCHAGVGVPAKAVVSTGGHFVGAALGGHDSQACRRCHNGQAFADYVGADGSQANNLSGLFYTDGLASFFADSPTPWTLSKLTCESCHNSTIDPLTTGLTKVLFPFNAVNVTAGEMFSASVGADSGICVQCHQPRYGTTDSPATVTANIIARTTGVTYATVSGPKPTNVTNGTIGVGNFTSSGVGSTTTLTVSASITGDAYKGNTALFQGNATGALNGFRTKVFGNDTSTITFVDTLPAAPRAGVLKAITSSLLTAAASGNSSTTVTRSSSTWTASSQVGMYVYFATGACAANYLQITANTTTQLTFNEANPACTVVQGDQFAVTTTVVDSVNLFPTATGGSTTTLDDANRAWTPDGKWVGYAVYFMSGPNAGRSSRISASGSTSITFDALPVAAAAGDLYQIVPDTAGSSGGAAVLDAVPSSAISNASQHRVAAAATLYGAEAGDWYQYTGKSYRSRFSHGAAPTRNGSCVTCHDPHTLEVEVNTCAGCHGSLAAGTTDVNGVITWTATPANAKSDVNDLASLLLRAIKAYADNVADPSHAVGKSVCFANGSTSVTPRIENSGTCSGTTYDKITPRLLRASFNYGAYQQGDPGAWAHNPDYVKQVLYDTIEDLNSVLGANAVDLSGFTRP